MILVKYTSRSITAKFQLESFSSSQREKQTQGLFAYTILFSLLSSIKNEKKDINMHVYVFEVHGLQSEKRYFYIFSGVVILIWLI